MSDAAARVAMHGAGVALSDEQRSIRETIARLCEG